MRKYIRHLAGQWKNVSFFGCYKLEESITRYPLSQTKGSFKNLKMNEEKKIGDNWKGKKESL